MENLDITDVCAQAVAENLSADLTLIMKRIKCSTFKKGLWNNLSFSKNDIGDELE
jgi:hypothetical protein